jgi:hypothetical protein
VAPPPASIRYELFDSTHELSTETLAALQSISTTDGQIRFSGSPAELAKVGTNEIILAGASAKTPKGLLRQVLAIRQVGGDTILDTQPVAVQLAFKHLHATGETPLTALNGTPGVAPKSEYSKGFSVGGGQEIDWQVFDKDGKRDTKDDQLYVTGGVSGTLTIKASIDLDWIDEPKRIVEELACAASVGVVCTPELPDLKVGVTATAQAKVTIDAEGAAATEFVSEIMPIEGTNVPLAPIAIGPVVLCPEIDFVAQIEGAANARFHAKAGMDYSITTGASIGLKSGPHFDPPTVTKNASLPVVETALSATLKASIGPRISVRAWDAIGPQISILGYGKLTADTTMNPCYSVGIGADLGVGLSLRIPWALFGAEKLGKILGLSGDIFNYQFPKTSLFSVPNVLTGTCTKLPLNVYPPGEGPSEDAYVAPTFVPWSMRFTDTSTNGYEFPHSGEAAEHLLTTDRAIDGSWLVTGEGLYGVAKLAEEGNLVWVRSLTIDGRDADELEETRPRAIAKQARNTRIWVATSRFVIGQLDQGGDVVFARRFLPDAATDPTGTLGNSLAPTNLVTTPDGGVLATFAIRDTPDDGPALLLRLDSRGNLLWSRAIRFETPKTYLPSALLGRTESGFDLFGFSWEASRQNAHLIHLDEQGIITRAKQLGACGNARVRPTRAIRLASGAIALAGSYDLAPERAFLAQLAPDLSFAGAETWSTGSSVSDVSPTALAQLPITGFVTASQIVPTFGANIRLTQHDARGIRTAEQEYSSVDGAEKRELFPGDLRLTNDGGLLLFGAQAATTTAPGGLWFSKIPANSLTVDVSATDVSRQKVTSAASACTLSVSDSPVATTAVGGILVDYTSKLHAISRALTTTTLAVK